MTTGPVRRPPRGRPGTVLVAALLAGLASALSAGGCQGHKGAEPPIAMQWTIAPDPPVIGPAKVSIALTDSTTGQQVTGAAIQVEGNMTHPGMQPVFGTGQEVSPGHYEAPLQFTMGGDWFLLIDATLEDGSTLHRQVEVRGVHSR